MARIPSSQSIVSSNDGFNVNKTYLPSYSKIDTKTQKLSQNKISGFGDMFGSMFGGGGGGLGSSDTYSEDLLGGGGLSGMIENVLGSSGAGSMTSSVNSIPGNFFNVLDMFSVGTNILNDYVNYTYHWIFFAADENSDGPTPEEGVIIAESGVTGLNIKEVIMTNVVNPSFDGKSNTHLAVGLDIIMGIAEPAGISLADNMIAAGSYVGSTDWAKQPYFMSVSFRGYNAYTGAPDLALPSLSKVWKVVVKKISSRTDHSGTEYTLFMTIINNEGSQSSISRISTNVRFAATTVGDCIKQLIAQLNGNEEKEIKTYYANKVQYDIQFVKSEFASDPESWEIIKSEDNPTIPADSLIANKERAKDLGGEVNDGAKEMPFPEGTRIEEVIELIIAATKEGRELAGIKHDTIQTDESGGSSDEISDPTKNVHHFIRVEPKITLNGFNTDFNDYNRSVTYYVHFQSNVTTVHDKSSLDYKTGPGKRQRVMEISEFVVRRYDYLFTGMNTEVINLNIAIDNYYAAIFPVASGFYNSYFHRDGKYLNDEKVKAVESGRESGDDSGADPSGGDSGGEGMSDVFGGGGGKTVWRPRFSEDQNTAENNIHKSAETQWNRGRAVMGSVLNQKMGRAVTPALLNIDLEIRGDPYWFGCDTLEQESARGGKAIHQGSAGETANYHDHSQLFLLAFDMPREYNKNTGLYSSNKENAMQGIYQVLKVTSTFRDGKFTQKLNSVRDIQTELDILG